MVVDNFLDFVQELQPFSSQKNFGLALRSICYDTLTDLFYFMTDTRYNIDDSGDLYRLFPHISLGRSSNDKFAIFTPTFGYWECPLDLNTVSLDEFRKSFFREYLSRIFSKSKFFQFYWAASLRSNSVRCFESEELKVEVYPNWLYIYLCDKHLEDDKLALGLLNDIYRFRLDPYSYFKSTQFEVVDESILRWFNSAWMTSIGVPTRGHLYNSSNGCYLIDNDGVISSSKHIDRIYNNYKEIGY